MDEIKKIIRDNTLNIEGVIVGTFWSDPQLYFDYSDLTIDKFKSPIWKFYFGIGRKLAEKDIKSFNSVDVEVYLDNNEKLKNAYDNYGGFETVEVVSNIINEKNIDSYVKELIKWDAIYNVVDSFNFKSDDINKIKNLNIDELYNYFSTVLNNVFINTNDNVNSSKLNEGLDEIIENADKGLNMGMPYNSPILSNITKGLCLGQLYLFGGLSGAGKSTFMQDVMLASIWEMGEPCVIMLNEQDHVKWKQQFLTYIINNIVLKDEYDKYFYSSRWLEGSFTEEEFEWINAAKEILLSKENSGMIIFIEFKSYSQKRAERIIKKYSSFGVTKFILDTFKLSTDRGDEQTWLSLQEDARKFDDLIKPANLNVTLILTLQLQKSSRLLRYLTSDNIGLGKNVIDVASVSLLMRRLWNDEYAGGTHEIKVKRPIEGTDCKEEVILDPKKKYVIIFIEKNRNGISQEYQVVAEQNLGLLKYTEVGICDIPMD